MRQLFTGAMATRRMPRWFGAARAGDARGRAIGQVLVAYLAAGAISVGLSAALGRDPLRCEGWIASRGAASVVLSLGLGVCLGAFTIAASQIVARRAAWGRALHAALRPAVHGAGDGALLALGVASAAGEELLFRGLLMPILGLGLSSVVFGVLHQVRGPGRWGWMPWATLMGFLFGVVFLATGSLLGAIAAHAAINLVNLRFVRDNDPAPRRRALGGLLRR